MYVGMGNGPSQPGQVFLPTQIYPIRPTVPYMPPYGEQQLPTDQLPGDQQPGFWAGLSTVEKVGVVAGGAAVLVLLYTVVR